MIEPPEAHLVCPLTEAASFGGGSVFCIRDSPDLGPLYDGLARSRFFHDLWNDPRGELDWLPHDAFAIWGEVAHQLRAASVKRLLIWVSPSGADHVFQRMAAHFLSAYDGRLLRVILPPLNEIAGVQIYPEATLPPFKSTAVVIDDAERIQLAKEFIAIAARPELLRLADAEGNLTFHGLNYYDQMIVGHCEPDWLMASHVVGRVMGYADGLNPVGDRLIAARLRYLVGIGQIEARGDVAGSIRDFQVRKAGARTSRPLSI